jgi:hypothetical protein
MLIEEVDKEVLEKVIIKYYQKNVKLLKNIYNIRFLVLKYGFFDKCTLVKENIFIYKYVCVFIENGGSKKC